VQTGIEVLHGIKSVSLFHKTLKSISKVISSKVKSALFRYLELFTIQSVSKQLYRDSRKIMQQSLFPEENRVTVQLKSVSDVIKSY